MTVAEPLDLPLAPPPGGQILHQSDRATVVWGDSRDPAVIAQVPNGYGLLLTDPPYGVRWNSGWHRATPFGEIAGDDGSVDWPAVLGLWARRLKNSRHVYIFGYSDEKLTDPLGLGPCADLTWDKCMHGLGNGAQQWGPSAERITFGVSNANPAHGGNSRGGGLAARLRRGTVLHHPRPNATAVTRHPTEKPAPLLMELIESSTLRGDAYRAPDLVVDPCAGSGSTAVAAVLLGRRAYIVEIDRPYADLAVERVRAAEKHAAAGERL